MKVLMSAVFLIASVLAGSIGHAQSKGGGSCAIVDPPGAKLTIEEFADFECPFCAKGAATLDRVMTKYPGKIRVIYRHLPLPMHPHARAAARAFAALCQQSPDLARRFGHTLFTNQTELESKGEAYIFEAANNVGADVERMKQDMNGNDVARTIAEDEQAASRLGINGTPSFKIGSELMVGAQPDQEFKKIIDRQL